MPGIERTPLALTGTLDDGVTSRSSVQRISFRSPEGDDLTFTQVQVNIAGGYIHHQRGEKLLNRVAVAIDSEQRAVSRIRALLRDLRLLSDFYDVQVSIEREEQGTRPYLSLVKAYVGREPGVLPAVFVQAIRESIELFDSLLMRPLHTRPDASFLVEEDQLTVHTGVREHQVQLQGLIGGTNVRASIWDGSNVSVRMPAATVDRLRGAEMLELLDTEWLLKSIEFGALFERLPLGPDDEISAQISGAWRRGGYAKSYLDLSLRLHGFSHEEQAALVVAAVREALLYCDVYADDELNRRRQEEQELDVLSHLEELSLQTIVQRRVLEGGLYRLRGAELRPGVPHFVETPSVAIVRIEPVSLHPAVTNLELREQLVQQLGKSDSAALGGLLINFVETTNEAPQNVVQVGQLLGKGKGTDLFYWQIMAGYDRESRTATLNFLDRFLRDYYLVLRTGIPPEELDSL